MKKLFLVSLTLNVVLVLALVIFITRLGGINYLVNKLKNPTEAVYQNRVSQFAILPDKENEIVFFGNSITAQGNWNELFNEKCINRGIDGDDTKGMLDRTNEVIKRRPAKVFIMTGVNDLSRAVSIEDIISNYRQIIKSFKDRSPSTRLYLQSTLPVNNTIRNQGRSNDDIRELNKRTELLANEMNAIYINLYPLFLNNNNEMDLKYSGDGIHINGKAYAIWKENIDKYVSE